MGPRWRQNPLLSFFLRSRHFLIFGVQSPPQFLANTLKVAFFGHLFWEHFYSIAACTGPSMLPTINVEGDFVIHSKLHSRGRGIKVGDLVSAVHPMDPHVHVLKRVVGMPGDFVVMEPTEVDMAMAGNDVMLQVPEGHCWLAGDNLPHSVDSRRYGPVPLGLIRGKALGRLWPKPMWFENGLKPAEV